MKLFLASAIDKTISILDEKVLLRGKKILFITNAADTYTNTWWIDLDRKAFKEFGGEIIEVDLKKISKEEFKKLLDEADIAHVCGGSVLYLTNLLREMDLGGVLKDAILQNKAIYTGTSAGSMIVAKDLKLSIYDEEERLFIDNSKNDFSGMALVDFYIIPHCQNSEFVGSTLKMLEHLPENKYPIILLNDNQAVWVEDEKIEVVSII